MKHKSTTLKKLFPHVFTAFMLTVFSFSGLAQSNKEVLPANGNPQMKGTITELAWSYTLVNTASNQWGFDIYKGRQVITNNIAIPGLENIQWYNEESVAIKVADFIIAKIQKEGYPFLTPVTEQELISADILLNNKK